MSFSFGFSGDDIEEDPNDAVEHNQQEQGQSGDADGGATGPQPIPARAHDLDEVVCISPTSF
jgi:protein-histidine N-methyltransferase